MKNGSQAYLFCYFTGENDENGEQICFAVSKDGLYWDEINGGKPVLISDIGEKGVRDPFIIRDEKENKFYLIATDLRIYGNYDWERATKRGSRCIIRFESEDLIHWSHGKAVEISVPDAGCTWAPEAIFDKNKDAFFVYWASTSASDGFSKQRIYAAYTKDFMTFTPPEIYHEQEKHIIDMTVIEHNSVYYRFYGSDRIMTVWADKVEGDLHASPADILSPSLSAQERTEGPFMFRLPDKDKWCLLLDGMGKGYYPLVTSDPENGEYEVLPKECYRMPKRARHGAVMEITPNEYERIKAHYAE